MTRIAVTGASGFVGRHVMRYLAQSGVRVLALSRRPVSIDGGEWRYFTLDHLNRDDVALIAECDGLVHLAWGGLPEYLSDRHVEVEMPLHRRFLDAVCSAGLRSLIATGTCLEYGMREGQLTEALPPAPHVPYAVAKNELRLHIEELQHRHAFSFSWARLFYLYGEGQAATSLWSLLQASLDRGDTRFPMSAGQQIRDFLPIARAAEDIAALALRRCDAGVVNVCSGIARTVEEMVTLWMNDRNMHIELALGCFPYPTYEPFRFWGSRTKLDDLLFGGRYA